MKKINVHKLMLQFDADAVTSGTPMQQALKIIDSINEELGEQFPDACPQLFAVPDEIEVEVEDDEEDGE